MRVFDSGERRAASLQLSAAFRQQVHVASPKSGTTVSGGVGQLSVEWWGRYSPGRQACEQAIGLFFTRNFLVVALLRISMKLAALITY
jgi:hypothetical protein